MRTPKGSAIFGGSFDPIHNGHIALIQAAQAEFQFDPLWIVPSLIPPHKKVPQSDPKHRLAMIKLALPEIPGVEISDFELKNNTSEPSYALFTIEHFKKLRPELPLYFILGADAFLGLPSWHQFEKVIQLCSFIVVDRVGVEIQPVLAQLKRAKTNVHFWHVQLPDISSTLVREKLKQNESIQGLVPPSVERYLKTNSLYDTF